VVHRWWRRISSSSARLRNRKEQGTGCAVAEAPSAEAENVARPCRDSFDASRGWMPGLAAIEETMLSIVGNVFYVLIAIAMVVLILLQRGAGANAGSGFGGGASATVFGARGSANFLSRSTAVLAGLFFLLSLGMGIFLSRPAVDLSTVGDLGVMAGAATSAAKDPAAATAPAGEVPQPAAPAASADTPAPVSDTSAPAADVPAAGKPEDGGKDGK
jgi:preprotein translocase subunit SecG